jgi:ABC-type multidrug transport system fused ATPase/permease subunit
MDQLEHKAWEELTPPDQQTLLWVALNFVPSKHKMVSLSPELKEKILGARMKFMRKMEKRDPEGIVFYCPATYLHNHSLLDNMLYGRPKEDDQDAMEAVQERVIELLEGRELLADVVAVGLKFEVGSKGDRLSGGQKQKIALARALLKDPSVMILDEATASLDNTSQKHIENMFEQQYKGKATMVAVVHRLDTIDKYDRIAVMRAGRITEMGTYDELMERKGLFYELVHGTEAGI